MADSDPWQSLFRQSERFLNGHGRRRVKDELAALAAAAEPELMPDVYGSGALLEDLERDVAARLGKPAAVFMPSGTMAQQIALRLHAEQRGTRSFACHPTCHLELHERRAHSRLHGLDACLLGRRDRLITRADLEALAEPIAALLLELPQREIGGQLPSWEELTGLAGLARGRGVALHLDGARLWECAPFYARPISEIAALFDSVYVSFYKSLGAMAGAALAGNQAFIAEARVWQRRHGGNLISLYPFALSARLGLSTRLERLPAYCERARRIAALFSSLPGVRVLPDPPPTNLFHVFFPCSEQRLLEASAEIARARRVTLFSRTRPCDLPGYACCEVSIGDGASALEDDELAALVTELLARATG